MWNVTPESELLVVGYNPESADLDHPNGEQVGMRFYLQATNERGDRRRIGCFVTEAEAEAAFWSENTPPVEEWEETYPEYGSQAWAEYGDDMQLESERRQETAHEIGFDTRYGRF